MTVERFLPPAPHPAYRPVAIAMGSNLEPRLGHLRDAARALAAGGLSNPRFSSIYETEPAHETDQPLFLNACVVGWTRLSPLALLDLLKTLEREAGRDPDGPRYGPRELDLDILLYADEVVASERLTVPHPRLGERAFALVPLAEIAGPWPHPRLGLSIAELAGRSDRSGVEATNLRLETG